MIAHVIAALRAVCRRVVIVGACRGYRIPEDSGIVQIEDLHPGDGPLAGIEALLASGLDDRYLVAACDQPLLTPALLRVLLQDDPAGLCLFHTEDEREVTPFPGVYPADWLPVVQDALREGRRSVYRLLACSAVSRVNLPPADLHRLCSINAPDDLEQLRHERGKKGAGIGT